MHGWTRRLALTTGLAVVVAMAADACSVRPVPEPPSSVADANSMRISQASTEAVRVTGLVGAIAKPGLTLRVSNPTARDRSHVSVGQDGSFVVVLQGLTSDTFYLEALASGTDDFLIAITAGEGDSVVEADAGSDLDGDDSPNAIDCAPHNPVVGGSRCSPACVSQSDCESYQSCLEGVCVTDPSACTPAPEVCEDALDNDCDGIIDDGCGSGACSNDDDCPDAQRCDNGVCTTCSPTSEVCGNGIDDDCDGEVDEEC